MPQITYYKARACAAKGETENEENELEPRIELPRKEKNNGTEKRTQSRWRQRSLILAARCHAQLSPRSRLT